MPYEAMGKYEDAVNAFRDAIRVNRDERDAVAMAAVRFRVSADAY